MTIQITKPEVEALINQRLQTGEFKSVDDLVWHALQDSASSKASSTQWPQKAKDMVELFAPLRGLNIDFEADRGRDTGREIEL